AIDLVPAVDHDAPDACAERCGELIVGLVVAVHRDPCGGKAGMQGDGQLAAGADVQVQALLGDPPRGGNRVERLGGVVDVRTPAQWSEGRVEFVPERAGAGTKVVLVDDVGGCAVLVCKIGNRDASNLQHPVVATSYVLRPQTRKERG